MPANLAAPGPGLLFGLLLLGSILGGMCAKRIRVPKVVGYLLAGIAVKMLLQWYLQRQDAELDAAKLAGTLVNPLQPVNDLALGLILFSLGSLFEKSHVKSVAGRVLKIHLYEAGLTFLGVFAACSALAYATMDIGLQMSLTAGVLLGAIAVATAPAATLFVIQEYDAKGPVSDTILSLVGMNNIASIVLFHVFFLLLVTTQVIEAPYVSEGRNLFLDLALTTLGSAVLGLVLGVVFSVLHAKLLQTEMLAIFLAVLIGLGEGCEYLSQNFHLSFNFLLTTLFMGAAFCNLAIDSEKLYASIRTLGFPIFASFFAIAGYELHLGELRHLGLVGFGYVLFRGAGKYWGSRWGVRSLPTDQQVTPILGAGMLCQAGVAIGLITFLKAQWGTIGDDGFVPHPLADTIAIVVLGSVVIFEVIGPLAAKWTVVRAGEVTVLALLGRARALDASEPSFTKLILGSLRRVVGLSPKIDNHPTNELRVEHVMRTNVKLLPASATFDEVLHFMERNSFNFFPVVDDDGTFVGIVRLSDIRDILYDPATLTLITATDLADPALPTAYVDQPLEELLDIFSKVGVEGVPVVESAESKTVIGIIEQRDVLRALHLAAHS
ncbi:MAG: CBS domain-containing protein [Planctomycetes bacterium]|nr:CBS domain-containing protein [Planctomycetota bacterium]